MTIARSRTTRSLLGLLVFLTVLAAGPLILRSVRIRGQPPISQAPISLAPRIDLAALLGPLPFELPVLRIPPSPLLAGESRLTAWVFDDFETCQPEVRASFTPADGKGRVRRVDGTRDGVPLPEQFGPRPPAAVVAAPAGAQAWFPDAVTKMGATRTFVAGRSASGGLGAVP